MKWKETGPGQGIEDDEAEMPDITKARTVESDGRGPHPGSGTGSSASQIHGSRRCLLEHFLGARRQ